MKQSLSIKIEGARRYFFFPLGTLNKLCAVCLSFGYYLSHEVTR